VVPAVVEFAKKKVTFPMSLISPFSPVNPWWYDTDSSAWDILADHPFFNINSSFFREANLGRDNRTNVTELENEYKVEVEVPGYEKAELDVEFALDGRSVTISGKRETSFEEESPAEESKEGKEKEEKKEKPEKEKKHRWLTRRSRETAVGRAIPRYWVSERSVGEFSRTFRFAAPVNSEKATARLENGVLTLIIPKTAGPSGQKVTIE